MDKKDQISTFSRYTQVSRETLNSLIKFEKLLIKANNTLNLIGKSTIDNIWQRHFLDSVQVIDFIDKSDKMLVDIGSGAGFPGLIISIVLKDRNFPTKVTLVEKSPKKTKFLKNIVNEFKLNAEVINENIFDDSKKIVGDVFVARAFKPLKIILQLMHNKSNNWKKIFIFLGKTGKKELIQASKFWNIEYKQRVSVTHNDSLIIEINRIKKK
jgi:16S rRNA (guanine527-N7)-methyltransferase